MHIQPPQLLCMVTDVGISYFKCGDALFHSFFPNFLFLSVKLGPRTRKGEKKSIFKKEI